MRAQALLLIYLLSAVFLLGCAGKETGIPRLEKNVSRAESAKRIQDPKGPIPKPNIPADMEAKGKAAQAEQPKPHSGGIAYSIETRIENQESDFDPSANAQNEAGQSGDSAQTKKPQSGDDAQAEEAQSDSDAQNSEKNASKSSPQILLSTFAKVSTLHRMQETPPETSTGVEQRLAGSLGEAKNVMHSYGYYTGQVKGTVDIPENKDGTQGKPVVRVVFMPGKQYTIGKTEVIAPVQSDAAEVKDKLPKTLADAGLKTGAPAIAADVLAAVGTVQRMFLDNGYPFAKVASTQYIVDHESQTLEAVAVIEPGAFVRMGDIRRRGAPSVKEEFIDSQRTWAKGRPWSQSRIESFHENLRQSGLFQSIELSPGKEVDDSGRRVVNTRLKSAPERTISGALKYHSDFGPGIQAAWEHRNLTGYGDSLRLSMPLWLDMQEISATYRRPQFLDRYQDFIAKASLVHEDVDAYRMQAGRVAAGIERKLSPLWSATVMASLEGGSITESAKPQREYMMLGLPSTLTYDSTGSLLNAEKGSRLLFSAAPYTGRYNGNFTAGRGQVEVQTFIPLVKESKLVLALRGKAGAVFGAESGTVPPSIRFYSGGGGSVRGYEYQSIGPKTSNNDPDGGGSVVETSAEARWKLTPEIGLVGFIDGGTVYENTFDDPTRSLQWGAGVGFRYYTSIGPVRFDVATPLNPRDEDETIQFYISIGQNF